MAGSWDQRLHAMDYLAYAFLQTGRDAEAERVLADLKAIDRVDPPNVTAAYAATAIPARLLLERRRWSDAAAYQLAGQYRQARGGRVGQMGDGERPLREGGRSRAERAAAACAQRAGGARSD